MWPVLMLLLATTMVLPPVLLFAPRVAMAWPIRYGLAALPAIYTGVGWQLGAIAASRLACLGGIKNLHACTVSGTDVTTLVEYGLFLMIPAIFLAMPLSAFLLLNTLRKQMRARRWYQRHTER